MELEEDEEDVLLPVTELAKYLDTLDVFGHFDPADQSNPKPPRIRPLTYQDNKEVESRQKRVHSFSQCGFICGQNLPDILLLLFSISDRVLFNTTYCRCIRNCVTSYADCTRCSFALMIWKLSQLIRVLRNFLPWSFKKSELTKAERIAWKFSLEHRLSNETSQLIKFSVDLHSTAVELGRLIQQLQNVKCGETSKCKKLIQDTVARRSNINNLISNIEKLLVYQENSIDRLLRRAKPFTNTFAGTDDPALETDNPAELSRDSDKSLHKVDSEYQSTFENDTVETSYDEEVSNLRDQFFELNMSNHTESVQETVPPSDYTSLHQEMKLIHHELLDNLRIPLLSRRAVMEQREARAYEELYGRPMELELEDPHACEDVHIRQNPESSCSAFDREIRIGEEENFGDDLDDEDCNQVKSEFLASLQTVLRRSGGR